MNMGGLCYLPLRGCGWWNAGPFCWWRHLCEDVRPLCLDNPKRPLSEPSPSAYYWTGEPTKGNQDFMWVFKWCFWTNCNHQCLSHSTSEISIWNSPAVFPEGLEAALQPANQVYSPWTVDPEQSSQRVACSRPHLAYYHTLKKIIIFKFLHEKFNYVAIVRASAARNCAVMFFSSVPVINNKMNVRQNLQSKINKNKLI